MISRFLRCSVILIAVGCGAAPDVEDLGVSKAPLTGSTVLNTSIPTGAGQIPIIRLSNLSLRAGQRMFLIGSWEAASSHTLNILQGAQIKCSNSSTASVSTTRNHEGTDVGIRSVQVRWLFTVPADGSYTCELLAHASSSVGGTLYVQQSPGTYLTMSGAPTSEDGAEEWRDSADLRVAPNTSTFVLRKTWTAAATASDVELRADLEVTNLTSSSEPAPCNVPGSPTANASVTTVLWATQLNRASPRGDCTGRGATRTAPTTTVISPDTHHTKIYHSLQNVPISSAAGCTRDFAIKLEVIANPGNPVCLHGQGYSNGIAMNDPP